MATTTPSTSWEESGLLPVAVANSVLTAVQEASAVMAFATTRQMPAGVEYLPLQSRSPQAHWLESPGERKPYEPVEWSAERLTARELALTTFVEDVYLQDATFPVEAETERALGGAIAAALDRALLFGEDAPPDFPEDGIAGDAPISGADALSALSDAMAVVEASGVPVTGIIAGPQIGSALRTAYTAAQALPNVAPTEQVFGVPVRVAANWDESRGHAIVGNFSYLVVGIRRDITVETSRDGVLTDDSGQVIANAFQDDVTLVRAHARFAAAIGRPVGPNGEDPIEPFATASW